MLDAIAEDGFDLEITTTGTVRRPGSTTTRSGSSCARRRCAGG